ncbi:hypothetical protein ADK67_26920 [Saccharothrix sp. NRRL B-16348]|uniref:hypothetical protein n=1 Tax=Saccharothrix sp. NRRL B-16348 TaxID=1415542 RepID=UPI0006AEB219|nr:hypothetical protein [Saccharothrix sp. NRRL B-16348]KOX21355.1 hypothetical protein ADK67_26920 [Saccharothrix sp. NRRL B-16348]
MSITVRGAAAALAVAAGLSLAAAPAAQGAVRVLHFYDLDRCRVAQLNYARVGTPIIQGCTADVYTDGQPSRWRLMLG